MNGDIKLKLGSLVIFRGLLKLPVIVRLTELDETNPEDTSALVYAYGAFMSELLKETPNFTEYLFTAVTEDENIYTSYRMSGKEKDDMYESMLDRELAILQKLSMYDGGDVRAVAPDEKLPVWKVSKVDFVSLYHERMNNIRTVGYGIFAKYRMSMAAVFSSCSFNGLYRE